MWLECIRYRFRLDPDQDCLELAQEAALQSLRHSPRCRSWRVLPSPNDPSLSILEIEWDAGPSQAPFRGSEEFAALHAALTAQVRALDEADYRTDARRSRRSLGGPDATFRLAEDIVARVMRVPELAGRFHSRDGSRRARLGLWLVEVLGGPALFSANFSGVKQGDGPLAGEPLDLDERELFLEVAQACLPSSGGDPESSVLGTLRANLPLYPAPLEVPPPRLLPDGEPLDDELRLADGSFMVESLQDQLLGEELSGDELLLESESSIDDGPPPRGYLAAPSTEPDRDVGSGDVDSGEPSRGGSSEPLASQLETGDETDTGAPSTRDRDSSATGTRRRPGRRYRAFDSGVFPHARGRQTAKR
jgi:hypothetical protein